MSFDALYLYCFNLHHSSRTDPRCKLRTPFIVKYGRITRVILDPEDSLISFEEPSGLEKTMLDLKHEGGVVDLSNREKR